MFPPQIIILLYWIYNFTYFFILIVLGLCCCVGFSLVAASGGYPSLWFTGFSLRSFSWRREWALGHESSIVAIHGLNSCSIWAQHHSIWAVDHKLNSCSAPAWLLQGIWDPPWIRARTHVACISRWILYHWATWEVLSPHSYPMWMQGWPWHQPSLWVALDGVKYRWAASLIQHKVIN